MSDQSERREYPRAQAKWPVTLITPEGQIEGEIENFTPKGLFVSCAEVPPSEGIIRLVIKVPGRPTMNVAGKVIWSTIIDTTESGARLGVGIQFTEISESDLKILQEAMKEYQGDEEG
jgi:Tfp pilus assembly protein PilZ